MNRSKTSRAASAPSPSSGGLNSVTAMALPPPVHPADRTRREHEPTAAAQGRGEPTGRGGYQFATVRRSGAGGNPGGPGAARRATGGGGFDHGRLAAVAELDSGDEQSCVGH